jgi:type IV secretory pathway TrbF-like protein
VIEREGQLLRRVALSQYIALGAIVVSLGGLAHSWHLGTKIKETLVPYVIEVNRKDAPEGHVLNVGILPQKPYARPDIGVQLHVLYFWLWYLRSVGDSKVLQGQAWQNVLAFSDESLHPWIQGQIANRLKIFQAKETVEVSGVELLPVDLDAKQWRVSWVEKQISISGEIGKPQHHIAVVTLIIAPPQKIGDAKQNLLQKAMGQKNTLGILVKKINWLTLPQQKGGQS